MQPSTADDNESKRIASRSPTVTIAVLAVTIALVFLVTFLASIPIPGTSQGQVFDAGDIMVFIVALTFGPMIGVSQAGLVLHCPTPLHRAVEPLFLSRYSSRLERG